MMKKNRINVITICFVIIFSSGTIFSQSRQTNKSLTILAGQYERLKNYEQALKIYKQLYSKNSADATAFEGIKRNLTYLKRYDEAIQLVKQNLKHKYSIKNHTDLGKFYFKKGDEREANRIWKQVIKKNPGDTFTYRTVANAMVSSRLIVEAIDVYKRARKNVKSNDGFMLELAHLYAIQSDYRNAVKEYLTYLDRNPTQYNFIERSILRLTNDPDAIESCIEVMQQHLTHAKKKLPIRQLLAGIYIKIERFDAALNEYKQMDEVKSTKGRKSDNGIDLLTFANRALQDGAYPYAEQAYTLILEKYPDSRNKLKAKYGLARTYQLQGNYENALVYFSELAEAPRNSTEAQQALYQVGEIKLNILFDPPNARAAYQKLLKYYSRGSKRYAAIFKIGETYSAEGNFENAREWYRKPLNEKKLPVGVRSQALFQLALLDFGEEKWDRAVKKLDEIVKTTSDRKPGKEQKLVNDALELMLLIEENKSAKEALSLFSQTILLEGRRLLPEAIDRLNEIVSAYPQSDLADDALLRIGELEQRQGHYLVCIEAYRRLIKDYSDSYYCDLSQKRIAEIYESDLGEIQQAQREYEQFMVSYPNSLYLDEVRKKIRRLEKHL